MTRTPNHDGLYGLAPQTVWQYDLFVGATHPEDRAVADRHVQTSVAPGGPDDYAFDFRVVWPDGSVHWLAVSGQVVTRDGNGQATLVRGALVDVTRLKQIEHELRDAVRELEESDRRKDEFLAMLAHELRNPMSALWFALSLLRSANPDPVAHERALEVMDRQMRHLRRLVDDLLDIARLSRGKLTLKLERLDLNEPVRRAIETAPATEKRHELAASYGPALPVFGDATRLEQIVLNLVTNARKYTDAGGRIGVTLAASADGREAVLTVSDSGIGIPADKLESIFEPFVQITSTIDRAQGGLGLGLALVRELAMLHGGRVRAESELGRGTRIVVTLPLANADGFTS
jgi:PAS domain S-box-containing protein